MLPLTPQARFRPVGPEGVEPSPYGLKVRCAAITPQSPLAESRAFQSRPECHDPLPPQQPVGESNPCTQLERLRALPLAERAVRTLGRRIRRRVVRGARKKFRAVPWRAGSVSDRRTSLRSLTLPARPSHRTSFLLPCR